MKSIQVKNSDGFAVLLRQNDLGLLEWEDPKLAPGVASGTEFRGKPVALDSDVYFVASLTRDNERRQLQFHLKSVEILGFSPKDDLIQPCEPALNDEKEYLSVGGRNCVVTTFTHLEKYRGWIKVAHAEIPGLYGRDGGMRSTV